MAESPKTTLGKLLSSIPLPSAPYEQFKKESPVIAQFIRQLIQYLKDLTGAISTAERSGLSLPSVPDQLRNWELVFDRDNGGVRWRPLLKWWVTPDIRSSTVAKFNADEVIPQGTYRIYYVYGGLKYAGSGDKFAINTGPGPTYFRYIVRHSDDGLGGYTEVDAPGNTISYDTQIELENINLESYIEINHAGGKIGVWLYDSPYSDNVSGNPAPTFSLE